MEEEEEEVIDHGTTGTNGAAEDEPEVSVTRSAAATATGITEVDVISGATARGRSDPTAAARTKIEGVDTEVCFR